MNMPPPTVVGGRYELGELLGRGGMAEVRKGTDTRLGRVVAVKRLRTDLASDATFQARFRREAQSSASLNHPAIVAVYDTGEEPAPTGSGDAVAQPYIVMEYVAGRTLRDILREGRKILPERALEITSDVLSALDYSHRAGIIHRDIKPGNVMLTPAGDVKVMDFGIARAVSDAQSTMTQTAAVVGTAQYLSPEQARGESVDSRSDVYSAGCLLYELLTGRPPFVGDSPVAVAYQHVRENPQPPSDHDADLPPEIDTIVLKALAKRVEDRYQSAAAMRADIERYLAGRPVQAVVPPPAPLPPVESTPTTVVPRTAATPAAPAPQPRAEDEDRPRSRAGLVLLLGVLVIAFLAGIAWMSQTLFEDAPEQVQVPSVVNLAEADARAAIGAVGLGAEVVAWEAHETIPEGSVISQDPARDLYVDPGATVELTVSTGRPEVAVPADIVGRNIDEARAVLEQLGFQVQREERNTDEPKGQVIDANPPAGTMLEEGATIVLGVSDGPEKVPDVVGMTLDEARRAIEARGFKVRVRETAATTEPAGTVIAQFPDAGTEELQGREVLIDVSTYVPPPPTPTPTPTPTLTPTDPATCVLVDPTQPYDPVFNPCAPTTP